MRKIIIHPFLIALFPVVSLWAANVNYVSANMVLRSLAMSIIIAAILLLFVHFLTREWPKAAVITSLVLLVVFTYGHFYAVLRDTQFLHSFIRHRYLLPFFGLLLGFLIILILKNERIVSSVAIFLTIMGLSLVVIPFGKLILYQVSTNSPQHASPQLNIESSLSDQEHSPDIYYIILDAYGRQDILKDLYGFDNSEFIQALEQRGFYVAEKSNTNYMQTLLSLSSSLNMDYLDEFISQNGGKLSVPYATELINNSRLRRILSERGYKMVAYETSFEDLSKADVFRKLSEEKNLLAQSILSINEFEGMLIDTTIGKAWLDTYSIKNGNASSLLALPYLKHRDRVVYTLTDLGNVAKMPGKKFVLAHVVSPHPPFVFDHNGDFIYPKYPYTITDGKDYKGGSEEYISGYTEQIQYINKLTLKAVDEIIANSPEPPVIIIQGDHGPGSHYTANSIEKTNLKERMGMLNAYYFPDGNYENLYPSISPVNSFRVILDKFFGATFGLLPDHHYFSIDDFALDESWTVNLKNVDEEISR